MVVICGIFLCVLLFKAIDHLTDAPIQNRRINAGTDRYLAIMNGTASAGSPPSVLDIQAGSDGPNDPVRKIEGTEAPSNANLPSPLRAYIGVAVVLVLFLLLSWFDNSTELVPTHDDVLGACFTVAGLAGLLCAGLVIRESKGKIAPRMGLALLGGILATLAVGVVSVYASEIVEGLIDFPPGRTTSYQSLLLISHADETSGRAGTNWYIYTTPLWSDLKIGEQDYEFMLAHRRPGDEGRRRNEIASQGYFCARVTIERFGNALRVMHAGTHTLPNGTVIVCPSTSR